MLLDMGAENTLTGTIAEARRQIEICNACRYCEGYCAVFPAINRERVFADGDIMQLAHLCHNCRGCYYSCQYIPPHEFAVNIPRILAETRTEDWLRLAWPSGFAGLFQRQGARDRGVSGAVARLAAGCRAGAAAGDGRGLLRLSLA